MGTYPGGAPSKVTTKVTDIKTHVVRLTFCNTVIVQVETDEGITGVAEALMKRKSRTIEQSILELKRYLVGKDPTEIETHWERMYRDSFWVGGPMHCTSISAVDCALWDILGKATGLPCTSCWEGQRAGRCRFTATARRGQRPKCLPKI